MNVRFQEADARWNFVVVELDSPPRQGDLVLWRPLVGGTETGERVWAQVETVAWIIAERSTAVVTLRTVDDSVVKLKGQEAPPRRSRKGGR
ncbi:hypothetical protein [Nannocystis exedens]|uniref:hypothetical protein n=1 Tax=Nannocystis exedens TaxID=54 RepID=UPI000BBA08DC|nr:hypothetical protein [Nannocystis exedens]PCC66467.1 hypothetical protein NAEX_09055 [Nannocystis exedens]